MSILINLNDARKKLNELEGSAEYNKGVTDAFNALFDLPPVNAAPIKHGQWITVSDGYGNGAATASICECSLCKNTIWVYKNDKRKWKFCPNCGTKMDLTE